MSPMRTMFRAAKVRRWTGERKKNGRPKAAVIAFTHGGWSAPPRSGVVDWSDCALRSSCFTSVTIFM